MLAFTRVSTATGTGEVHVLDAAGDGLAAARRVSDTASAHGDRGCDGATMIPVWSPDSGRVAFTCSESLHGVSVVMVAAADGSRQFSVPAEPTQADSWPTWSPESDHLAFARRDLNLRFGDPGHVALWTAEVTPTAATDPRLLVSGEHAAGYPRWSPVGDEFLFVELDELSFRPTLKTVSVGTGATRLLYAPPADRNVSLYYAAWSPDGGAVALPVGDGLHDSVLHVIDVATGSSVAVSPADRLALAPAWSPDGSRLVFDVTSLNAEAPLHRLATAAADGRFYTELPVAGGQAYEARWRPST